MSRGSLDLFRGDRQAIRNAVDNMLTNLLLDAGIHGRPEAVLSLDNDLLPERHIPDDIRVMAADYQIVLEAIRHLIEYGELNPWELYVALEHVQSLHE